MGSPTAQKLRSGNASRISAIIALRFSRPLIGPCIGYWNRMSGAPSLSTTERSEGLPQNFSNHSATMALFADSFDMIVLQVCDREISRRIETAIVGHPTRHPPRKNSDSCSQISLRRPLDFGVILRGLAAVDHALAP